VLSFTANIFQWTDIDQRTDIYKEVKQGAKGNSCLPQRENRLICPVNQACLGTS
jgi:hypothetical protein